MPKLSKKDKQAQVSMTESRRRKEFALCQLREMEVRKKKGELLDASEVKDAVSGMVMACRAKLLVLGEELSDKLASTSDPVRCREMVDDRIALALEELSRYNAAKKDAAGE